MKTIALIIALIALTGCSAAQHRQSVQDTTGDSITVGKVQREIRMGMSGAEVIRILGSPNIVSTDENRREVWVYDKVATDVTRSKSNGGVFLLLLGANFSAGASSQSQRTLTIIIKFDEDSLVRDFSYHTSKF